MTKKPILLIILDGFGYRKERAGNPIAQANTPHLHDWFSHYPHTLLTASGQAVGLPAGKMGNSEVGHLTIGAGRVIEQPESFILKAIENGSFYHNEMLHQNLEKLRISGKNLHIIGLLSDGGIHCHEKVIHAFIKAAAHAGIANIYIHPILDGRDAPPKSAAIYLQRLEDVIASTPQAQIGSIHGRFYAMDRDSNWERTQKSYEVLSVPLNQLGANGKNENRNIKKTEYSSLMNENPNPVRPESIEGQINKIPHKSWQQILEENYSQNITDEFIPPTNLDPEAIVSPGDAIIFANYRPDRARQLTECFVSKNNLAWFLTPVSYGSQIHTEIMYPQPEITNTLKEILAKHHKTIFSIAETEKYAHVTYFFDGGREMKFPGETRVLIPSIRARNYIDNPQMSAPEITQTVIKSLRADPCDFYVINYANADMVSHSGDFESTKKAIEILDAELAKLYDVAIKEMHGTMFITADHGNAEEKYDKESGQPHTAHTTNPVPFLMLDENKKNGADKLPLHQLADIMGFVLKWMGIKN